MLAVGFAPAIGGNAMKTRCDGSQGIIDEALSSMAADCAGKFDPQTRDLSEFCRRTGLTRQRASAIRAAPRPGHTTRQDRAEGREDRARWVTSGG